MKKKLGIFLITLCMCLGCWQPSDTVWAASGKTSVSVSGSSVNIGDTVTVSAKATGASGERAVATMALSWDSGVLQFVSCSTTYGGGGGSVTAVGDSFTVTLKAVAAGTSSISLSGSDGVVFDTNEGLDSMAGSSTSVTVNNAASTGGTTSAGGNTNTGGTVSAGGNTATGNEGGENNTATAAQSADNSLKSLTISPGTLSPAFAWKTTTYSATVGNDVTSIAVSATPSNDKAVVESVSGNDSLKVGSNAVKVVVKAENGVTATYTINVTRQAAGDANNVNSEKEEEGESETTEPEQTEEVISIDGLSYQVEEEFAPEDIPADFTETTVNYHGTDYKGVSFNKGSLNMLCLAPADAGETGGKFFVYDAIRDTFYSFVKMTNGEKYVIALLPPVDFTMPEDYLQTAMTVSDGNSVTAYQKTTEEETEIGSDFYLFYAVNHEGTEGWYQYDALEDTYQRIFGTIGEEETASASDMEYLQEAYNELSDKYTEEKAFARNVIAILIFIAAVLVIIIINLLIHRFRRKDDDDFPDDDFPDDDSDEDDAFFDEEEASLKKEGEIFAGKKKPFAAVESIFTRKVKSSAAAEEMEREAEEKNVLEETSSEEAVLEEKASSEEKAVLEEESASEEEEEQAERRKARELFFAEELPHEEKMPEKPLKKKKAGKKEETHDSGDLEIIDFNDL